MYKESVQMPQHVERQVVAAKNLAASISKEMSTISEKFVLLQIKLNELEGRLHSLVCTETETVRTLAKFDTVPTIE